MIVAVALCMAFWNMMKEGKETPENDTTVQNQVVQPSNTVSEDVRALIPDTTPEQKPVTNEDLLKGNMMQQKSIASEDQVIDIVKNTKLASKKQTIGEYLQSVYGIEYQTSWSAKPFTDNVYIVEFFASQVRNEPYVYLFRVDMDQKKITGALNNITLDLLA